MLFNVDRKNSGNVPFVNRASGISVILDTFAKPLRLAYLRSVLSFNQPLSVQR